MTDAQSAYIVGMAITATLLMPALLKMFSMNRRLRKANRLLANQSDADQQRLNHILTTLSPTDVVKITKDPRWTAIRTTEHHNKQTIERMK